MEPYNRLRALILSGLCLGLASADDCFGPITVEGQADVTSLAKACKTYSGPISVAEEFSGELNLNGFEHIQYLTLEHTDYLTGINASSLRSADIIKIYDATNLRSISFSNLVVNDLALYNLPALSDLSGATGVKSAAIRIDRTSVSSLDGLRGLGRDVFEIMVHLNDYLEDITLYPMWVSYLSITDNANQAHVSFPNLKKVKYMEIDGALAVSFPKLKKAETIRIGDASTVSFPNLKEAEHMDIRDASSVSIPNLKKAEHMNIRGASTVSFPNLKDAGYVDIDGASTISLPSLTAMTGTTLRIHRGDLKTLSLPSLLLTDSLVLEYLHNLSEISLPKLYHICGGLHIKDTALSHLSFDSLQSIVGDVWIIGDFDSISLPKLAFSGARDFYVEGSKKLDCHALAVHVAHAVDIRTAFQCMAGGRVYDLYGERTLRMLRITARGHQFDPRDDPRNTRIRRITAAGEPLVAG